MNTKTNSTPAPKKGVLQRITGISFGWQVIIGLVLGIALGFVALWMGPNGDDPNWLAVTLKTIGSIFVTLLKALVPPLVFLAIVSSIANLRKVTNAARLAGQTILWFAITSLIAVVVGIALGVVTGPGKGTALQAPTEVGTSTRGSWMDFLNGLVPVNFLGLTASANDHGVSVSFNTLQILVISIAIGIAALKVGEKATPFLELTSSLLEIVQKVLWWVIRLAPIGTVGLLGNAVVAYGWDAIGSLGIFVGDIYLGLLLVFFVVYPILLRLHGLSVRSFYRGVWPATELGFVSRSSMGTMPMTQFVSTENLGVPKEYASFAIPLGATTKMDGCAAIYPALSAIFVANFFGVPLHITDYLLIAAVAVFGSAATAGMTGAIVMLTLTLSTLGLPLEGVGLLLAVDPILDMGRTALNVTGQALVAVIVSAREKILDKEQYDSKQVKTA